MKSRSPNRRSNCRTAVSAGMLAVVAALAAMTPTADTTSVRSKEWPLDAAHFNAARIQQISSGANVVVAVVDSGIEATHPDLVGRVMPGVNLAGDGIADGRSDFSPDSHGTSVAALIAGSGTANSGTGILGLAPGAKLLPVRVSEGSQVAPATLAEGIAWAADHGARVINVSIGSPYPDPRVEKAVAYAQAHNCVVVASAGNSAQGGNPVMYPAGYPGVVAVTGTTSSHGFWPAGESGIDIDLAAPAQSIESANDAGQYIESNGTSYSAAYVSATAALIAAKFPHLMASQIIQRLIRSASNTASPNEQLGYGEINPLAALTDSISTSQTANPLLVRPTRTTAPATRDQTAVVAFAASIAALASVAAALAMCRRRTKRQQRTSIRGSGAPRRPQTPKPAKRGAPSPKARQQR